MPLGLAKCDTLQISAVLSPEKLSLLKFISVFLPTFNASGNMFLLCGCPYGWNRLQDPVQTNDHYGGAIRSLVQTTYSGISFISKGSVRKITTTLFLPKAFSHSHLFPVAALQLYTLYSFCNPTLYFKVHGVHWQQFISCFKLNRDKHKAPPEKVKGNQIILDF